MAAVIHRDLSEVEKSKLRGATPERVEHLFTNYYYSEVASYEDLLALQTVLEAEWVEAGKSNTFGRTWAF